MSDHISTGLKDTPSRPSFKLPPGACNSHAHVFGPYDKYPLVGTRQTAVATLEMYLRMLETLGFERGLLTQPSHYGVDNRALYDALDRTKGNVRGIVVLTPDALTDVEIARLEAKGVRGVRIRKNAVEGPEYDDLEAVAERLRGTKWHIELTPPDALGPLVEMRPRIEKLGVPVVFEQMGGCPDVTKGVGDPAFTAMLSMMRDGVVWAKLSHPYHLAEYPYSEVLPFAQALVSANPKRCVFATDWPHPRAQEHGAVPDDGFLVDLFPAWVPDAALQKQILVDNPNELYRFS